jgi:hypothetical protein
MELAAKDCVHCGCARDARQPECCAKFCAAVQNGEKKILRCLLWHDKAHKIFSAAEKP